MNEHILGGLSALISLGAAAQWLAWRVRIPSILVLLAVGFVAGPVTGLLDPDALLGPLTFPLVSLGAAVVLFEGGLTASWQDIRSVAQPVRRLITIGLVVTWTGTTALAHWLLDLKLELAALLGGILVVTGPTVVGPLLRHARPRGQVGAILKFEGILNDPLGAIFAVLVFQVIQTDPGSSVTALVLRVAAGGLLASAMGWAASRLYVGARERGWLPESLENAVLLPLALGVYALTHTIQHESGLLAVTVMGIALASQDRVNVESSVEFTAHARTMLISVLFVLLTARMELSDLTGLSAGALGFVALLIVAVRPLAVWLSTLGTRLGWRERAFIAALAPRGIVAAAVSSVFALRLEDAGYERATVLMPLTFTVIAACVAVYGLGAIPLVRLLGLQQSAPHGVMLLGANPLARLIALTLRAEGVRVVLVDADRSKIIKARGLGLWAEHGRVLSERVLNRLDLSDIGHFVALTSNDDTNTLAVAHFREVFGPGHVHQLQSEAHSPRAEPYARRLRGAPIAPGRTYELLLKWVHRGAVGKVTQLTEAFSFDDYRAEHGPSMTPLFAIAEDGATRVIGGHPGEPPVAEPAAGERVVSLVLTDARFDSHRPQQDDGEAPGAGPLPAG